MHCLRQASSRLLSSSSRIPISRNIRPDIFPYSTRVSPFSTYPARWNSSKTEPPVTPVQAFEEKKQVKIETETEASIQSEEVRTSQSETIVGETKTKTETQTETWDEAKPAAEAAGSAPSKRQTRMHKLNEQMREKVQDYAPVESETLYVGNLFYDVEAEDLRKRMENFGTVMQALIVHDNRGLSKGFGYVQFSTIEEARNAMENMHLQVFEGRQVVVQFSHSQLRFPKKSRHPPSNTLFIGNIPYELTDRDVQALFSDLRNITDVRFPVDRRTGSPRGFCHVEFLTVESASQAKEKLSRKQPYGRVLKVEYSVRKRVSFAAPDNLRRWEEKEWESE